MDKVILTIKSENGKQLIDIEVPFDMTAKELQVSLSDYMQLNNIKYLWAEPLHRKLIDNETLKDAGVWEGSYIIIKTTEE